MEGFEKKVEEEAKKRSDEILQRRDIRYLKRTSSDLHKDVAALKEYHRTSRWIVRTIVQIILEFMVLVIGIIALLLKEGVTLSSVFLRLTGG